MPIEQGLLTSGLNPRMEGRAQIMGGFQVSYSRWGPGSRVCCFNSSSWSAEYGCPGSVVPSSVCAEHLIWSPNSVVTLRCESAWCSYLPYPASACPSDGFWERSENMSRLNVIQPYWCFPIRHLTLVPRYVKGFLCLEARADAHPPIKFKAVLSENSGSRL